MLFGLEHQRNPDHSTTDAFPDTDEFRRPYRIDVFATDVVSAITHAGGWLYDHAARGWHVTVIANNVSDSRPLRILGVDLVDLDSLLAVAPGPRAHLLNIATELLESDPQVQQLVLTGFSHNRTDIAVWANKYLVVQKMSL
ncbi:hypothetical protein [Mycobacterium colombiense]|uniref:hypothetical protein n=1 Tax=Mycobacterium colombiense TaxID=339268 RepID=UPI000B3174E6|nr:hypothetical protein [Mycobacterium colombiense]